MNDCLPDRAAAARAAFDREIPPGSDERRAHMRRLAGKSAIVRKQKRLDELDRVFREQVAEIRATCDHVWPAELTAGSTCTYCDLPYGEWSE